MKIKKLELEALIEKFLFEDKTSDAFRSINVASRDKLPNNQVTEDMLSALATVGLTGPMIKSLGSTLGMSDATAIPSIWALVTSKIPEMAGLRELFINGIKHISAYLDKGNIGEMLSTSEQLTAVGSSFAVVTSVAAMYGFLPIQFMRSLEQSSKIQNSLRNMKKIQAVRYRDTKGRVGIAQDVGLSLDDINDGAVTLLLKLLIDDEEAGNEIIVELGKENVLAEDVIEKVQNLYKKFKNADFSFEDLSPVFTREEMNDAFFFLKSALILLLSLHGFNQAVSSDIGIDETINAAAKKLESTGKKIRMGESLIKKYIGKLMDRIYKLQSKAIQ